MGGYGSGRRTGYGRTTVESCPSIDVNRLNKEGDLLPGTQSNHHWTSNGETVASIQIRAGADHLRYFYREHNSGRKREAVGGVVHIARTPCRYGGSRPYFVCPGVVDGVHCGRHVVKLYGLRRSFRCRHCHRLVYSSQSEGARDRKTRRANKIRRRLSSETNMAAPFPKRPKGMWQRTYDRLRAEGLKAEATAFGPSLRRLEEFLAPPI